MVKFKDLVYGLGEIAEAENLPVESWEEFAGLMEHFVALYEPGLIDHPDYDRAVRVVFERLRSGYEFLRGGDHP